MTDTTPENGDEPRWTGATAFSKDSIWQQRADAFFHSTNWDALAKYVSERYKTCEIDEGFAIGGRHMVRSLKFEDNSRWIVRVRMPPTQSNNSAKISNAACVMLSNEVHCIQLVRERTLVPVPEVFEFNTDQSLLGSPFMLMGYVQGDVAMDLNFDSIPNEHKHHFYQSMAVFQAQVASIKFPKIGSIVRLENGSYDTGPIPGLGGPFETAQEYFSAWGSETKFPRSDIEIEKASGSYAIQVSRSIKAFPGLIKKLAGELGSSQDLYALQHSDYGHNNAIVNERYVIKAIIDWEGACTVPIGVMDYPLTLRVVPRGMDLPSNYNEDGTPTDADTRRKMEERKEYLSAVLDAEARGKLSPILSNALKDPKIQDVATAMRLYSEGKMGLYRELLEQHYTV